MFYKGEYIMETGEEFVIYDMNANMMFFDTLEEAKEYIDSILG